MSEALPGSLEHWADVKPDQTAIIEDDSALTWGEWNDLSNRLAHGLAAQGISAGDIVVTRTHIRTEWPVIRGALAKLGCQILGLNWRLTPVETKYVLSNSGANAIICDDPDPTAIASAWSELPIKLAVSIDAEAPGFVSYDSLFSHGDAPLYGKGDPPLIIYTSGTTGLPKGVVMGRPKRGEEHKLMEYMRSLGESRPQARGDVVFVTMPMHHGAGPGIIGQSLRGGNTMVFMRRFDPEGALQLIEKHKISFWTGVPTMYKRIAGLPSDVLAKYDVSSIDTLGVGAAPVPHSLKLWIADYFGDCLHEGYGATETGMMTALTPEMQKQKPGSSGYPHKHVEFRIRNDEGHDLPVGEVGEIWVRTPVVISQYLNGAPLGTDTLDAEGFFRVGDVGRLDEDGYIYITDRSKDMIISGGVNIYPAEIEAALLKHAAVQDAAVIGIPDDEFGEQVKAFCELKPGQYVDSETLLEHCKGELASYKRPRTIDIVEELPRNTMGKLLKRELREPYWKERERKV